MQQSQAITYHLNQKNPDSLKLLSLDGGGMRGLVLIQILLEIESKLQKIHKSKSIIDYFNWIAGTSTGAILALALVDGFSLFDCLKMYLQLKDDIFSKNENIESSEKLVVKPIFPIKLYSAQNLEEFLQNKFGPNRKLADLKKNVKVMVTATRANVNPPELVLFRNYDLSTSTIKLNDFVSTKNYFIWKAARCSSAAPTYFSSVDNEILDGGLISNNPTLDLLTDVEFYSTIFSKKNKEEKKVSCIVSLGTGKVPKTKLGQIDMIKSTENSNIVNQIKSIYQNFTVIQNLKKILIEQIVCSDGTVVKRAEAWANSIKAPFFRFTPQLEFEIPLDTTDNEILIELLWNTKVYVNEVCIEEIKTLVDYLAQL